MCAQELECAEAELSEVTISISVYVYRVVSLTAEMIKTKINTSLLHELSK